MTQRCESRSATGFESVWDFQASSALPCGVCGQPTEGRRFYRWADGFVEYAVICDGDS